jgi:hypothetical protein
MCLNERRPSNIQLVRNVNGHYRHLEKPGADLAREEAAIAGSRRRVARRAKQRAAEGHPRGRPVHFVLFRRKGRAKAIGAAARHLAEATYWVLSRGKSYPGDPRHLRAIRANESDLGRARSPV